MYLLTLTDWLTEPADEHACQQLVDNPRHANSLLVTVLSHWHNIIEHSIVISWDDRCMRGLHLFKRSTVCTTRPFPSRPCACLLGLPTLFDSWGPSHPPDAPTTPTLVTPHMGSYSNNNVNEHMVMTLVPVNEGEVAEDDPQRPLPWPAHPVMAYIPGWLHELSPVRLPWTPVWNK